MHHLHKILKFVKNIQGRILCSFSSPYLHVVIPRWNISYSSLVLSFVLSRHIFYSALHSSHSLSTPPHAFWLHILSFSLIAYFLQLKSLRLINYLTHVSIFLSSTDFIPCEGTCANFCYRMDFRIETYEPSSILNVNINLLESKSSQEKICFWNVIWGNDIWYL